MNIDNLYDVLYAMAVVVGIACVYTLAIVAAGHYFKRPNTRALRATTTPTQPPTQPSTQTSDTRELVLR